MKALIKNKSLVITIIILLVVIFGYRFFRKTEIVSEEKNKNIGADVVELFKSLESVKLKQDVFSSPLYKALTDFSINIPAQPVGRQNPFDSIGRD